MERERKTSQFLTIWCRGMEEERAWKKDRGKQFLINCCHGMEGCQNTNWLHDAEKRNVHANQQDTFFFPFKALNDDDKCI